MKHISRRLPARRARFSTPPHDTKTFNSCLATKTESIEMPRIRDMKKANSPLMTVLPTNPSRSSRSGDHQYSDDEKSTVQNNTMKESKRKSAMKRPGRVCSNKNRPQRRIRFTAYDEVMEIPHIRDLSQEEIESVWMSDDEHRQIRRECLGTVGEAGDEKLSDGFFLRGLDQHTNRYKNARDFIGRQVYDAVLSVQEFEKANGIDCSELMAQMSIKYSEPSVVAAQSAAISDIFSSFKDTWTHRSIPTIPDGLESGTWETQC